MKTKKSRQEIGRSSVKKGKAWELIFCKQLEKMLGIKFIRTRASEKDLKTLTGDIVCTNTSSLYYTDLSWQIKAREAGSPAKWMLKANDDARGKLPIVIWQKRNRPVLAFMKIEHLARILYELEGFRKEAKEADK